MSVIWIRAGSKSMNASMPLAVSPVYAAFNVT